MVGISSSIGRVVQSVLVGGAEIVEEEKKKNLWASWLQCLSTQAKEFSVDSLTTTTIATVHVLERKRFPGKKLKSL